MNQGSLVGKKYRLTKPIGEGAMGVVWAAVNELTWREVALKLITRSTPDMRVRLMREAQACGKLAHRNIIEVFDVDVTDSGDPFLVMPLLSGENLAQRLESQRRFEPVMAARIARDVARALEAAHAASIIHRDLKPANIFLHQEAGTDGEVVKVLDFGVSKNLASTEAITTVAGGPVGSPAYMSPEQFRAERDIDPRTDLWSLGAVLFEMLTGTRAFRGDATQVMHQVLSGNVPRTSSVLRRADPKLDAIVARCLEPSRERRISSARELAWELDEFLGASEPSRARSDASARSPTSFGAASEPASRPAGPPGNPFALSPSAAAPLALDDDENVATMPVDLSLIAGLRRGPAPPAPSGPEAMAPTPSGAAGHVPTLASPTTQSESPLAMTMPLDPRHIGSWHGGARPGAETGGRSGAAPPSSAAGVSPSEGFGGTMLLPSDVPSRTPTLGAMRAVDAAPPPPSSHPRAGDPSMTTGAAAVVQVPSGSAAASDAARLAAASASSAAALANARSAGKRQMMIAGLASALIITPLLLLLVLSGGDKAKPASPEIAPTATAAEAAPVPPGTSAPAPTPAPTAVAEPPATSEPVAASRGTSAPQVKPAVAPPSPSVQKQKPGSSPSITTPPSNTPKSTGAKPAPTTKPVCKMCKTPSPPPPPPKKPNPSTI